MTLREAFKQFGQGVVVKAPMCPAFKILSTTPIFSFADGKTKEGFAIEYLSTGVQSSVFDLDYIKDYEVMK